MTVRVLLVVVAGFIGCVSAGAAAVSWPTGNSAFVEGKSYDAFVQPTVSGKVVSGLFGCVRSDGRQFHEGLDLFPVERDRRGEPVDTVHAILPGVVRYVSKTPGNSSFGRYVVVEHTGEKPALVSLYAHLASVRSNVHAGATVDGGQIIGVMGRSAGGYSIPRERSHLHLEFGVWLTREFPAWYAAQRYKTKNQHGLFNGYNIVGLDFLDFVERQRAGQVVDLRDYVERLPTAVSVVVRTTFVPDFVRRYPELVHDYDGSASVSGWTIDFTWFGLPKSWTPLTDGTPPPEGKRTTEIVFHDSELLSRFPCHEMVRVSGGNVVPGSRLQTTLGLLFSGD